MKELIDPKATAAYLGVSQQTLANWRYRGEGPRFYRVGRIVKYAQGELDAWLDEHASDTPKAAS